MAWRAGAALTLMESTHLLRVGTCYKHKWYGGAGDASYENVTLVDANRKKLPVRAEPSWGDNLEQFNLTAPMGAWFGRGWDAVRKGVLKGEYALPFYGDFPNMSEIERKVTWGLMIGEEAITKAMVRMFTEAGFDPGKDMLQCFQLLEGDSIPQWRDPRGSGGLVVDWNLKTTLEGLYAAGAQLYAPGDHSFAAATVGMPAEKQLIMPGK